MKRRSLFVIMPFGERLLADGRVHNFDDFYQTTLRSVATDEGWDVLRVDELVEPGTVTHQAMRHLYSSDLVVADVSAPNSNVYFELGARQAMSPGGTILVAAAGTALPFDISNQRVLYYDFDYRQDRSFVARYTEALRLDPSQLSNPIQRALGELGVAANPREDRASFERELDWKIERARTAGQLVAVWNWAKQYSPLPTGGLLSLASRLARIEDYATAAHVLSSAYPAAENDYEIHRQRGFYLRKHGDLDGAERELRRALELNRNDPETLGILGGTLKRQGRDAEALESYQRGVVLAPASLYLRIAHAGMTVVVHPGDPSRALRLYQGIAEWVDATPSFVGDYWADLVAAEAHFALGDFEQADQFGISAIGNGAHLAEVQSAAEQIQMIGAAGLHPGRAIEFADWLLDSARRAHSGRTPAAWVPSRQRTADRRRVIFHLSDTHFGSVTTPNGVINMHRFVDGENSERLSVELTEELQQALVAGDYRPEDATIVISGDLTYTAKLEEFELVNEFLKELCASVGIGRDRVVLVPGNHDIDWAVARESPRRRFDNYLEFAHKFYGEELFRRRFPHVTWDLQIGGTRPEANEIIYYWRDGPVTYIGINSCVFEDHQHHYGFVGKRQLDRLRKLLDHDPRGIRVAVMHHHLHPYPEPLGSARTAEEVLLDMSTVRDAGLVEERLARLGFSLLLHGHKHKPQLRETLVMNPGVDTTRDTRPLIVSGCGSTGVSKRELEHNRSNHFAIIELLRTVREPGADFLRVHWRELGLTPGAEWASVDRWTMKG